MEFLEDRNVPAFLGPVDYFVGGTLQAMVAADFNNDTVLDLAVVSINNSTVSVLLGNGDGTFRAALTSATGDQPVSLAVGDLDGDGNLDLATANFNDVSVLLGDGEGTFTPASGRGITTGASPQSVAMGDFNGDGLLDLGVSSYDYTGRFANATVLLGNGDGSFSWWYDAYLGGAEYYPSAAVAANLNGDGFDDFVTVNVNYFGGAGNVHVLLGGSSGLQGPSTYLTGGSYAEFLSVAAADLDADGDTDLVTAGYGGNNSVLLGNGTGSFTVAGHYGGSPRAVVLGDFTGDGRIDLATANLGTLSVLYGGGDGTFSSPVNSAVGSYGVAAGDFNGDGWLDAATFHWRGVSVLTNDRSWPSPPPTVSVGDATVTEGNAGAVNATFTVNLSHASNVDVTVHHATADISAAAGSDYTAASGDMIIPAGQTSATVTVAVTGDRLGEANETFAVNLSAAANATIGDGQGIGTILDDEPRLRISDVRRAEGRSGRTTLFTFTVTLSAAYDEPVTLSYSTADGTATTRDNDYVAQAGTLTFAPGETTKTITIEVRGDSKREANETFYLDLFDDSGNAWFTKSRGLGTIRNDD
jgi:hypothetical protein